MLRENGKFFYREGYFTTPPKGCVYVCVRGGAAEHRETEGMEDAYPAFLEAILRAKVTLLSEL